MAGGAYGDSDGSHGPMSLGELELQPGSHLALPTALLPAQENNVKVSLDTEDVLQVPN